MASNNIYKYVNDLNMFLVPSDSTPFNYERYLLVEKGKYLDAFINDEPFPPFEIEIQMSSNCNLSCRWCIGNEVQDSKNVLKLQNNITTENVDNIINGIINFRINDLKIDTVKFSGFIGEPLVNKDATLKAIRALTGAGFRVGLFTNGVLMDEGTWPTLVNIDYVHISLDSGQSSFFWLKQAKKELTFSTDTYEKVISNISDLDKMRKTRINRSNLKINVGYIIVPGNHDQIYNTVKDVFNAGADLIRFKIDIIGKFNLKENIKFMKQAFDEIERAKNDFENSSNGIGKFKIHIIHSEKDIMESSYKGWHCSNDCFFHNFLATVGSDGKLYLCDHNTTPAAVPLGVCLDQSIKKIWQSERRSYLIKGIPYICQCDVCPPFGNAVNSFLYKIDLIKKDKGVPFTKEAVHLLREQYRNQNNPVIS